MTPGNQPDWNSIQEKLDDLSSLYVLADPADLPLLARMNTRLEDVSRWAGEHGLANVAQALQATAGLIEKIVLNETEDSAAALALVGDVLGVLQEIYLHQRSPAEAKFPPQLGLGPEASLKTGPLESPTAPEGKAGSDDTIEQDPALLAEFVSEAREHLGSVDVFLLKLETDSCNEEALHSVFRAFHTIKGVAGMLGLAAIGGLAHEAENLLDRARKHELILGGPVIDVIFETVDALKELVDAVQDALGAGRLVSGSESTRGLVEKLRQASLNGSVESGEPPAEALGQKPETCKKLGEILVERGVATPEVIEGALQRQQAESIKLGEALVADGRVSARDVVGALRAQKTGAAVPGSTQVKETVKVDADRLDRLVETIGELVIAESMVSQYPEIRTSATLVRYLNELDKITRELQELGTSLRMVPLRSTFQKMARLARDLAKKAGKPVEFTTSGEETELDKTVVDRVSDPLMHMVRNAVDHGLEANPEERRRAGKPESGHVELRAFHRGGSIYIEIEDDGRGLNREAILNKGRERGLIHEAEVPNDRELFNLIFQPGFSTAKAITDVSGRGVGMDVVKRAIDSLRGQVDIRTEAGRGTTLSIRLPLTLAIIDGMVVRVGGERYIVPTLSVVIALRPRADQMVSVMNRGKLLLLQGEQIPLFHLDRIFGIRGAEQNPEKALVLVVEDGGAKFGLLVDELLGQQQIVIKSLGESLSGRAGISGGAIMPDGHVGLIVDVGGLVSLARGYKELSGKF